MIVGVFVFVYTGTLNTPPDNSVECWESNCFDALLRYAINVIDKYCLNWFPSLDDATTQSRPRASSATSLGASSGYQSEEEPDESSKCFILHTANLFLQNPCK